MIYLEDGQKYVSGTLPVDATRSALVCADSVYLHLLAALSSLLCAAGQM